MRQIELEKELDELEIYLNELLEDGLINEKPMGNFGIELVDQTELTQELHQALSESYSTISFFIVISYKGYLFRTETDYGSYGYNWNGKLTWHQVTQSTKQITVNEYTAVPTIP